MQKYGFVYIWFDRKRKMYYVGCHWGTEDDGYICSSNRMRNVYKRRPSDFKRRILTSNIATKIDLLDEENRWLRLISKNELGTRYYNLRNNVFNHWAALDNRLTIAEKISKRLKGVPHTEERNAKKRGRKLTEEHKAKVSLGGMGRPVSEETRKKIGQGNRKTYRFLDKTGNIVIVENLQEFCKKNDLLYEPMVNLYNGKYDSDKYKGWQSLKSNLAED